MKINKDKYKFYGFDMDLTLLDARECAKMSYTKAHSAVGDTFKEKDLMHFLTIPLPDSYAEIENPTGPVEKYIKVFEEETRRTVFDYSKFFDDGIRIVKYLHSKGFKIGIVTNRSKFCINGMLDHCPEIKEYFDVIISNEDCPKLKPNPDPMLLALKRAGVEAKDAVYFGDARNDRDASKAAGIDFICVNRFNQVDFEVENIIKSFDEIEVV